MGEKARRHGGTKGLGGRALRLAIVSGFLLMLAGCATATIDGIRVSKYERADSVIAKLGEPDDIEVVSANVGSCVFKDLRYVDAHYYLERKLVVMYDDGRIVEMRWLRPESLPGIERRASIRREVSALVPIGATASELRTRLGPPDFIEEQWVENGMTCARRLAYTEQLERTPVHDKLLCYYRSRNSAVMVDDGKVSRIIPIYGDAWRRYEQTARQPSETGNFERVSTGTGNP
jgi:hypothetical protein